MLIEVSDPRELGIITDVLHDHFFSLPSVLSQRGAVVIVEFKEEQGFFKKRWSPRSEYLTIHHVRFIEVNDSQQVRLYDVNELIYVDGVLRIKTGITLKLLFHVDSLHLTLRTELGGDSEPGALPGVRGKERRTDR